MYPRRASVLPIFIFYTYTSLNDPCRPCQHRLSAKFLLVTAQPEHPSKLSNSTDTAQKHTHKQYQYCNCEIACTRCKTSICLANTEMRHRSDNHHLHRCLLLPYKRYDERPMTTSNDISFPSEGHRAAVENHRDVVALRILVRTPVASC